jgi:sialic acid synthase SpsE
VSKFLLKNNVMIVAEISANHQQDYEIAVKTLKAAKEAGADAVKLPIPRIL